jgi:hypothetical protein
MPSSSPMPPCWSVWMTARRARCPARCFSDSIVKQLGERTTSRSRSADRTRGLSRSCPSKARRAQGMPGAGCTHGPRAIKKHAAVTTGSAGTSGIPCAVVLTVSFVLSPVTRLCCHRHRRDAKHHRQLSASLGAPGPHDFSVRVSVVRLRAIRALRHYRVHRISASRVVTIARTPLSVRWNAKRKPAN